jgi:hypothetical protein
MIILLIRQDIDIMIGIVCARLRIVGSHQPVGHGTPGAGRADAPRGATGRAGAAHARAELRPPQPHRAVSAAAAGRPEPRHHQACARATSTPPVHRLDPSADPILRGRAARRVVRCDPRHAREIRSVPPAYHPRASVCTQYTLHRRADAWPRHGRTIQY